MKKRTKEIIGKIVNTFLKASLIIMVTFLFTFAFEFVSYFRGVMDCPQDYDFSDWEGHEGLSCSESIFKIVKSHFPYVFIVMLFSILFFIFYCLEDSVKGEKKSK